MRSLLILFLILITIVVVGVNVILYSDNLTILSPSPISKSIDPLDCHVYIYNSDTDTLTWTEEINKECMDFRNLPLSEQYAWCDRNPGKCT